MKKEDRSTAFVFMEGDVWSVPLKQLEANCPDHGFMFCEDCHQQHLVFYRDASVVYSGESDTETIKIGLYSCKGNTELWSIEGKRVD